MEQLDVYGLGVTAGRIEQKIDSLFGSFSEHKEKTELDIAEQRADIQILLQEKSERKGASMVWGSIAGFVVIVADKVIEHLPSLLR